ncbi:MAG: SRPBCC family protein [Acidimicrobiia bacterium]
MRAPSRVAWGLVAVSTILVGGIAALVSFMTRGKLTLDLGWGRSMHELGPVVVAVGAPRDMVFDQVASAYLGRTPRAARNHLDVLERGENLVVAAHRTRLRFYTSVTVEAVGFHRPERVTFRHLRGPVPHAVEEFVFREVGSGSQIEYRGQLGIDFWLLGRLAGRYWVRPVWERAVEASLEQIKEGAEKRASARRRREPNQ